MSYVVSVFPEPIRYESRKLPQSCAHHKCDKSMIQHHVEGTNRRTQSALFLNRKCIFKTLSTWLMDVNNLDFTPFTTEKAEIHWICSRSFVGLYELQHYRSSAVQLGAFLWACPFKIMLQ